MIEEIKKEIYSKNIEDERKFYITISKKSLDEILDKHNNPLLSNIDSKEYKSKTIPAGIINFEDNQPDYKSAFEELEKGFKNHTEGWLNYEDQSYMCSRFENLKKKYNLGGE